MWTCWCFPTFFVLASHTQACFSWVRGYAGISSGHGKNKQVCQSVWQKGSQTHHSKKNWTVSRKEVYACICVCSTTLSMWRECSDWTCAHACVCTPYVLKTEGRGGERSHFISNMTSFLENIYLISFSFQGKLTSMIAPRTSWKINSGVFEIPQWICQGYLAWAYVYLFWFFFFYSRMYHGCVDPEGI